jgi:hypothetical protein
MTPSSLVEVYCCFGRTYYLLYVQGRRVCLASLLIRFYISTLKMEAVYSSETSVKLNYAASKFGKTLGLLFTLLKLRVTTNPKEFLDQLSDYLLRKCPTKLRNRGGQSYWSWKSHMIIFRSSQIDVRMAQVFRDSRTTQQILCISSIREKSRMQLTRHILYTSVKEQYHCRRDIHQS